MSKLSDRDFVSYICKFDFVCLVETFIENCDLNVFDGFKSFYKPAIKFLRKGDDLEV